jgi:rhamnosyl/mannosyltransferase
VRIVHVGKFYPPEYLGGLETVNVTLARSLAAAGHEVECLVAAVRGPGSLTLQDGVRVRRVASLGILYSQPLAPGLPAALRRASADVVHLHHPNPLGDIAVLRDRTRPLIVSQHSDIVRQRWLWPLVGPLVRRVLTRAHAVVVASRQLAARSLELRGFEAKVRVIPFGIDPAPFAAGADTLARARALRERWGARMVVLGVGRLVGYKGWDVLVRAARDLDATVVLVGSGPEEGALRALAGPNAVFAGRVEDADLPAYYHAADVFCLPSVTTAEAFGMVLLEAMACGKPLVTTALPTGVSEVNRPGETGLSVAPGDAQALRGALSALLGDEPRRRAMGEVARRVCAREYSSSLMAERFAALYAEAVSARQASSSSAATTPQS